MERLTSLGDWQRWQGRFAHWPIVGSRPCASLPPSWRAWWRQAPCSALLETGKAGRFTILVPRIDEFLIAEGYRLRHLARQGNELRTVREFAGSPPDALRAYLECGQAPPPPGALPFVRGMVGYFSYDFARFLERLPATAREDLGPPLALWGIADRFFAFDHQERKLFAVVNCAADATLATGELAEAFARGTRDWESWSAQWSDADLADPPPWSMETGDSSTFTAPRPPRFSLSRSAFVSAVRRVQEYIRAGDTYQVNLSLRESRVTEAAPEEIYEALRRINPSPYMALLRFPEFTLVSGSPELLVRLRGGKIEARPIAGTRPRHPDPAEDERLARELLENSKEQAEHLMLVDLIRNDIGRVAAFGSVKVTEFMTVENYSHVRHIVSHIEGRAPEGCTVMDVVAATFPGGTITGAPKVRTMEIIEELEPVRRGIYTGSIGWIGFHGEMELNIAIRTLVAKGGEVHVQAGAGIVADSDPEREYDESISKGRALWAAVKAAEGACAGAGAR